MVPKRNIIPSMIEREKTKTAKFTSFLISMGVIPVKLDDKKDHVSFKFWSRPMMYHLIIQLPHILLSCLMYKVIFYEMDFGFMASQFTTVEKISVLVSSLIACSLTYPVLIARGLASSLVSPKLLSSPYLAFPKQGIRIIIGFFLIISGNFLFNYGIFKKGQVTDDILCKILVLNVLSALFLCCFWTFSSFLVVVWVQSLIKQQKDTNTTRENYLLNLIYLLCQIELIH